MNKVKLEPWHLLKYSVEHEVVHGVFHVNIFEKDPKPENAEKKPVLAAVVYSANGTWRLKSYQNFDTPNLAAAIKEAIAIHETLKKQVVDAVDEMWPNGFYRK